MLNLNDTLWIQTRMGRMVTFPLSFSDSTLKINFHPCICQSKRQTAKLASLAKFVEKTRSTLSSASTSKPSPPPKPPKRSRGQKVKDDDEIRELLNGDDGTTEFRSALNNNNNNDSVRPWPRVRLTMTETDVEWSRINLCWRRRSSHLNWREEEPIWRKHWRPCDYSFLARISLQRLPTKLGSSNSSISRGQWWMEGGWDRLQRFRLIDTQTWSLRCISHALDTKW